MKKYISALLSFLVVISSVSAAAEPLNSLVSQNIIMDKLMKMLNYEAAFDVSFKLEKPIGFLDQLDDVQDLSPFNPVNVKKFVESLFNTTESGTIKCNISEDYKKISLSCENTGIFPLEINSNLKSTVEAKTGVWLDMDFSDNNAPLYKIIEKTPMSEKYYSIDLSESLKGEGISFDKLLSDSMKIAQESFGKNASITYDSEQYRIEMTDEGFKNYIIDVFKSAVENNFYGGQDELFMSDFNEGFESMQSFLKEHRILGNPGLVMEGAIKDGQIKNTNSTINIDMNLYDLLGDFAPGFITHDNSDLKFTVKLNQDYIKTGEVIKIEKPFLTEDNSIDLMEFFKNSGYSGDGYEYEYEYYEPEYFYCYGDFTGKSIYNNKTCIPLRSVMYSFYIDDAAISCENQVISVAGNAGAPFQTLKLTIGSNIAEKNGNIIMLEEPVNVHDGVTMLTPGMIKQLFNADLSYISYGAGGDVSFELEIKNIYGTQYSSEAQL